MNARSRSSNNMQKAIILTIVSNLAIGAALCAPQNSSPSTAAAASSSATNQPSQGAGGSGSQSASIASTADKQKSTSNQFSSAASTVSGSPSIVNLRSDVGSAAVAQGQRSQADAEMDGGAFDGKNPFADDSLWQIPIHLVRNLNDIEKDDIMAKSSNSRLTSDNNQAIDDDDDQVAPPASSAFTNANSPLLSSSSPPQIISASTDLKTAAGYHYPSAHEHHEGYGGGHESAGHHGGYGAGAHHGHHGGDHYGGGSGHGGKYFQYASVPYPGSWEFGYRRGNPYHTIERYEHAKGPHFKTKVKWSDKHGGYGVHVWDYNHDDHHSHHYGGDYDSHAPSHYGSGHYGGHQEGHYGHH